MVKHETPRPQGHLAQWFRDRGIDPTHVATSVRVEVSFDRRTVQWSSLMELTPEDVGALAQAMDADDRERWRQ